jgi:ABC-type Na+ efflux pump permease subunit
LAAGLLRFFVAAFRTAGIWVFGTARRKKPVLNLALVVYVFIYFGYSSFAYIPIRATAQTDLNNSHPDNAFTLYGYLNRFSMAKRRCLRALF